MLSFNKKLTDVYKVIQGDMLRINEELKSHLRTKYSYLEDLNDYFLSWGGKRIRPALVMLSARTIAPGNLEDKDMDLLILLSAAVELIHSASLIHDDIIDNSPLRRNKSTIHKRWGREAAVAFGDYIYSKAFELVANCSRPDVLGCVAQATTAMCEGQLFQVLERKNLNLKKSEYIVIVKKKTASLIAACCKGAALIIDKEAKDKHSALAAYGLNFGIAFQIVDDYLDIMAQRNVLGKISGQDISSGELTLPLYDLIDSLNKKDKKGIKDMLGAQDITADVIAGIRDKIKDKKTYLKTKERALFYARRSKDKLNEFPDSCYKDRLSDLADYVVDRGFKN
ncbi:MAG: hypothetical protein COV72_03120 [Candidatus Omnitrophica bacterium CG11_big_fil_rev_8_21_14_0_20_42_13]|uniref:Polyprenyl synthetase n=1 Tax=Candidatus Ghiorseimicrobium undicola TaxID=1974746 RepID=A0A2H0LYI3_9BACT|nr:MAG: hypothetical protein COV72_03120 [Candidatus Omnitrophica bacterium CG11_big_fil_rev_8_21_14_0_20_42_13]